MSIKRLIHHNFTKSLHEKSFIITNFKVAFIKNKGGKYAHSRLLINISKSIDNNPINVYF